MSLSLSMLVRSSFWSLTCFVSLLAAPVLAQNEVSMGTGAARAGESTQVLLSLVSNPGSTAMQVDVAFDSTQLVVGTVLTSGSLTDHIVASSEPTAGQLRILVYSPTNAVLPVGQIALVPFTVVAAATVALSPLTPSNGIAATPDAISIEPLSYDGGTVHIYLEEADLNLELTAAETLVENGDPLSFALTASNPGPDDATGVQLIALAPPELVSVSWSCSSAGGATCTALGASDVVDNIDLPVGGSVLYTINSIVSTASPDVVKSADLEPTVNSYDPVLENNSRTLSVDVCLVDDLVLDNWNIGGVAVFNACETLTVGPSFNVQGSGDVTLRSLGGVIFLNGFSLEDGGVLLVDVRK